MEFQLATAKKPADFASTHASNVGIARVRIGEIVPDQVSAGAESPHHFSRDRAPGIPVKHGCENHRLVHDIELLIAERKLRRVPFYERKIGIHVACGSNTIWHKVDSEAITWLRSEI